MKEFVVLIRGINVGPNSRVAMADLRAAVTTLGYSQVRTVLNSGNLLLETSDKDADEIRLDVERALLESSGVSACCIVFSAAEFHAAAAYNPLKSMADNLSRLIIGFLESSAEAKRLQPLLDRDWSPEALALGERTAYMWCVYGVIGSTLLKAVDAVAGEKMTTRSTSTVERIAGLLGD
ncbi:MAG: DUF1697 domain-containing protein [Anaerolineae bacterium]